MNVSSATQPTDPITPTSSVHHQLDQHLGCTVPAAPKKRPLESKKALAVRLNPQSIYEMLFDNENLLNEPFWDKVTHIFFNGLDLVNHHIVLAEHSKLFSAKTYLPWILALKQAHPFLKIYWTLPPVVHGDKMLYDTLKMNNGFHGTVWVTLNAVLKQVKADGLELALDGCPSFDFPMNLAANFWSQKTVLTLPNNLYVLKTISPALLQEMVDYSEFFLLNSFGFFRYGFVPSNQRLVRVLKSDESGVNHFLDLLACLSTSIHKKVLLGMDTAGTWFHLLHKNTDQVLEFKPMANKKIDFTMKQEQWYTEWPTPEMGSVAYHTQQPYVISYDRFEVQELKLTHVMSQCLAGVVTGDLVNDLNWKNPQALLNLCYNKLFGSHEQQRQDCLISPQPSKRARKQSDSTSVPK